MQDNKIFKPKEDGGCYEILILKISPRTKERVQDFSLGSSMSGKSKPKVESGSVVLGRVQQTPSSPAKPSVFQF